MTATATAPQKTAKTVMFRTKKKRYVYWYEEPVPKRGHEGRVFFEGGKCLESDNHLLTLETGKDDELIKMLRESPRMEADFYELKVGEASKGVKAKSEIIKSLMAMDRSALVCLFSDMELKGLGMDENAEKEDLVAAFLELDKDAPLTHVG